ncbi:MAG: sigma-54 interaction domain-containing protein [Thermodesulfobacteriota bacterium]
MNEVHQNGIEGNLIGESPEIRHVIDLVKRVAPTNSTVLITGESGTGKELIARAIHDRSHRRDNAMITINCGAIPAELLESELFGHEKGAFTGAHQTRIGKFEIAHNGTIFLDEIGEMSPSLQVKLLRVIQDQTLERVGGTRPIQVNTRILAATNRDLKEAIRNGGFREDLYYRLNVIPIQIAPLRNRKSDIPILVNHFQEKLAAEKGRGRKLFTEAAMTALLKHSWPGNVRELENLMERLYVMVDHDVIGVSDLPECLHREVVLHAPQPTVYFETGVGFNEAVEEYQKDLILEALRQTNWVKAKAAEMLKMNRTTLVEKIKKLKLEDEHLTEEDPALH